MLGQDPRCVASSQTWQSSAAGTHDLFFSRTIWSPDGTCLLTSGSDNALRTFVLPPDLVTASNSTAPHVLEPYSTIHSGEPVYSFSLYPHHALSDPATTLLLASARDQPVKLHNTLHSTPLASFPLIYPSTEEYVTPHSLQFSNDGNFFVAGSTNRISLFDVSRYGERPFQSHPTIPSARKSRVGHGIGMKGIVSALDISTDGILAAGTFTRWISLYEHQGMGARTAVFPLTTDHDPDIGGSGITQVIWSPCGRYLYIVERGSNGIIFYDVRGTGQNLGYLSGRQARTSQRMHAQIISVDAEERYQIWAGGTDGYVRVWDSPHLHGGVCTPTDEWQAHPLGGPVSSAVVHPTGGCVIATSCGGRMDDAGSFDSSDDEDAEDGEDDADDNDDAPASEFCLKVWSL